MIKTLRIDERLIHGQVAGMWCSTLSVQRIVIADDEVVKDELRQMTLKMAAPANVKVAIMDVKNAIDLLNDPRMEKFNTMILASNPKNALELVKNVKNIPFVNVGNVGLSESDTKKQINTSVFVSEQDEKDLLEIAQILPESNYQMTPSNPAVKLSSFLKQA